MVSELTLGRSVFDESTKYPQWSSKGHSVHLIDSQPRQLQDSVAYIEGLRKSADAALDCPGDILVHSPDELGTVLRDSWLIVEVILPRPPPPLS